MEEFIYQRKKKGLGLMLNEGKLTMTGVSQYKNSKAWHYSNSYLHIREQARKSGFYSR